MRQYRFHRVFDGAQVSADLRSQQGFADDCVSKAHHLGRDIHRLATGKAQLPALQHGRCETDYLRS